MNKKLMALATDLAKVPGSTGVYRSAVEVSDGRVIVHVQTKEWTALVQVGMIEGVHPPAHWEHKTALAMARAVNRFDGWKWAGEDVVHECGLTVTPAPGAGSDLGDPASCPAGALACGALGQRHPARDPRGSRECHGQEEAQPPSPGRGGRGSPVHHRLPIRRDSREEGMKLSQLGTEEYPVRASSLEGMAVCEGLWILRQVAEAGEREITEPMASGSAAGRAIELWHKGEPDPFDQAMAENPLADEERVGKAYHGYAADPRNHGCVETHTMEGEVAFSRRGVWFSGHVDQVREVDGVRSVWDTKLSKMGGAQLVDCYMYQLAVYAVGLGVEPGGIIRLTDYGRRGGDGPVMYPSPMTLAQAGEVIEYLTSRVQMLRRGHLHLSPGLGCSRCESSPSECEAWIRHVTMGRCALCGAPVGRCGAKYCSRQCAAGARRG